MLNASDRIALLLGRAIMRAESLDAARELQAAKIAELEAAAAANEPADAGAGPADTP